eukprot:gnl/MRDRNA2_/MRDRNA2_19642_c0_seq1.p1 gnl/MRDRNA2_/MRDRNA2_19642_c0~~gnl/MRDRNA2_/MRDRNA2_19642_c0_seq1.p1  ORF type:complete len:591 (+),score=119.97 gnl/MRDRNA2_/MRDRNA2_19642_c0_seq1:219-1775(+)
MLDEVHLDDIVQESKNEQKPKSKRAVSAGVLSFEEHAGDTDMVPGDAVIQTVQPAERSMLDEFDEYVQQAVDVVERHKSAVQKKVEDEMGSIFHARGLLFLEREEEYLKSSVDGSVQAVVHHPMFDAFFGILIIVNAVVMAVQAEFLGQVARSSVGLDSGPEDIEGSQSIFDVIEISFACLFLLELTLRLYVGKRKYLKYPENWIDILLVLTSFWDAFVAEEHFGINISFARLFRIAKFIRVFRVMRVAKLFFSLRILVKTIAASIGALAWSMVLLGGIEVIAAIFMGQMLHETITRSDVDIETRLFLYRYFGSFSRSMLTMFEITTGGWAKVGRPIIEDVHPGYAVFFVIYASGISFAVMKVITAVFLRQTLQVANNDSDISIAEKMQGKDKYVKHVKSLFLQADTSGDGKVDWQEFAQIVADPKVKAWLAVLEIEVHEAKGMFHLLNSGDGLITFDDFMSGLLRLRGTARSADVITLLYENQKLMREIRGMDQSLQSLINCTFQGKSAEKVFSTLR